MSRGEASSKGKSMDNYEGALETGKPRTTKDNFTQTVERYTGAMPSSIYLGIAAGAMALSLALHLGGRGEWARFIAQWGPACLVLGVYDRLVKLEDHGRTDDAGHRGYRS